MKKITLLIASLLLFGSSAFAANLYLIANNASTWTSTPTGFDNVYKVDLSNSGTNGTTTVSLTQWLNDRNAAAPTYLINGVAGVTFATTDQVWVAGGTYNIAIAWTVLSAAGTPTPGNIYGGFVGTENTVNERAKGASAWNFTNETIINSSTSTTGAIAAGGDRTITFDGITFNGFGTTQAFQQRGNMNIQNCKFTSNTAAAIVFYNGTKNTSVTNSYFYNNSYPTGSNAACINLNTSTATVVYTVSGCVFESNSNASTSSGTSAGIKTQGSGTYNISNCIFKNNKATGGSSSAVSFTVATSNMTNCLVYGNVADAGTLPGLYMTAGTVTNCSFLNTFKGTYINSNAATTLTNCVFWGTLTASGQINTGGTTANITLNNCAYISTGTVNANNSGIVLPATNTTGTNAPNFTDPDNNIWTLAAGSSLLDMGTSTNAPATDLLGTSRPQGSGIDIGAYERTVTTGIADVKQVNCKVINGCLMIDQLEKNTHVNVYSVTGKNIYSTISADNTISIPLSNGIYIVNANNINTKVVVNK